MVHKITVSSYCRNKNATHRVKSLHGKEQLTPFQWIHHWFIVTHIKTIGSLSSISKQLSSNGFTTASASQAIKWTHTLVHCHPYQNNWFIVIHVKTLVTRWIHHCFNQMIHTWFTHQATKSRVQQLIWITHPNGRFSKLQFSGYSHSSNFHAQAQHEEANAKNITCRAHSAQDR